MWRCIFATLIINKTLIFPSASGEIKAFVTMEDCRVLTAHIPNKDVAYKGGVNVKGKPVKPADLSPAPDLGLNDTISFLLILDVAKENRGRINSLKQFDDHAGLKGDMSLGKIVIKNGKVTLDGKSLAPPHRRVLNEFCRKSKNLP